MGMLSSALQYAHERSSRGPPPRGKCDECAGSRRVERHAPKGESRGCQECEIRGIETQSQGRQTKAARIISFIFVCLDLGRAHTFIPLNLFQQCTYVITPSGQKNCIDHWRPNLILIRPTWNDCSELCIAYLIG